jgi:hypothetical protein
MIFEKVSIPHHSFEGFFIYWGKVLACILQMLSCGRAVCMGPAREESNDDAFKRTVIETGVIETGVIKAVPRILTSRVF